MSGWRMAFVCAVPVGGALLFLKLVADSLAATTVELESLENVKEKDWFRRRERAERKAQEARGPQVYGSTSEQMPKFPDSRS